MCNNSTPSPSGLANGLAGFLVGTGYDEVTGLGSLDAANFLGNIVPPDFSWTGSGSHTAMAGQTTLAYNFAVTPTGEATFATTVKFSCSFSPEDPTLSASSCTFNPPLIAAGAGTAPVAMTITTVGPNSGTGSAGVVAHQHSEKRLPWLPLALPVAGVVMVGCVRKGVSRRATSAALCISLGLIGLLMACGGGNPVVVTVSPLTATLYPSYANWPAQTQTFAANVANTSNTAVSWSATPGSIDASGKYTAPTAAAGLPASVTVTATSQADSTKFATATVTLKTATVPNTYTVTVTAMEGNVSHSQNVTLTAQ